MIIVAGTVRIDRSKTDEYLALARTMIAETRKEAGCIVYSFAFDVEDPELVRIYEEWETSAHLKAHFEAAHMAVWRAGLAEIGAHSRSIKTYEADEGTPL